MPAFELSFELCNNPRVHRSKCGSRVWWEELNLNVAHWRIRSMGRRNIQEQQDSSAVLLHFLVELRKPRLEEGAVRPALLRGAVL